MGTKFLIPLKHEPIHSAWRFSSRVHDSHIFWIGIKPVSFLPCNLFYHAMSFHFPQAGIDCCRREAGLFPNLVSRLI